MQEFHINRRVRDRYHFDQSLYEFDGNVVFANLQAVRQFVKTINDQLDPATAAEKNITSHQINALGLIDEILHFVFGLYRKQVNPNGLKLAYSDLEEHLGADEILAALEQFCLEFPPVKVYRNETSLAKYLSTTENRLATLEEMMLLWLSNRNQAFMQYGEFFDDTVLTKAGTYPAMMKRLSEFFAGQPGYGPRKQDILTMLHEPAVVAPYSLAGQLEFIRSQWSELISEFLLRILGGMDLIKEETRPAFGGPGPAQLPDYDALRRMVDLELERFSPDSDWMPRLVLLARNSYVWLYQLSLQYGRDIRRLDQIPDEELDKLARAGITGLWLIGLWERSKASENIKKMCGNPEAVASAYSILDYQIAWDLGGEEALQNLKVRAWQRGIRLASDMVPNHMGIDSNWVLEHPDYFISVDQPPYPAYSFNGPNLSPRPETGIFLEDHYYNRSDAAVVFKRVDFSNGDTRYIYHGNDGTTMPWNDTAQLNYLLPQVREEVMQLILRVARDFPIIRFDAAMTLAKKHFQRLWYPEPGHGGAIPSRSEHALSMADFQRALPEEFWREVVDRVAREVPDTLLLAEAFWLMESYFVRTLGMHRVYNSAFMNMLRNEENGKYRGLIKNTLEFDPEILKRFVNFMNNPDERTAVEQFGKGDKYFGICTLMVTLPGLPMFGHGQIEGLAEKYGMEYRRAYMDEQPDPDLIARHEREIFPLTHQRHLFSGVENFCLYDFFRNDGGVDEDVFAYSNGANGRRALVIYLNRYASTEGWIRMSASALDKSATPPHFVQKSLGQGLGLHADDRHYVILHELKSGMETLYRSSDLHHHGLRLHLEAYSCLVYDWIQEVEEDGEGSWAKLYERIGGRPVRGIFHMLRMLRFNEFHTAAKVLFEQICYDDVEEQPVPPLIQNFLRSFCRLAGLDQSRVNRVSGWILQALEGNRALSDSIPPAWFTASTTWLECLDKTKWLFMEEPSWLAAVDIWTVVSHLHLLLEDGTPETCRAWMDEYALEEPIREVLLGIGELESIVNEMIPLIFLAVRDQAAVFAPAGDQMENFARLFSDSESARALGVNRAEDTLWFRKESMRYALYFRRLVLTLAGLEQTGLGASVQLERLVAAEKFLTAVDTALPDAGFKVERLLELLRNPEV